MSLAIFQVMLLSLIRDRGALILSFLVPPLFFVIFAAIFTHTSGNDLKLKLALADEAQSMSTQRLMAALSESNAIRIVGGTKLNGAQVSEMVRQGNADAGLIIRKTPPLDALDSLGPPPLLLLVDPARALARPIISGQIMQTYFAALPDLAMKNLVELIEDQLVSFTAKQHEQIASALGEMREETQQGKPGSENPTLQDTMIAVENVTKPSNTHNHVAYYAGAVAVLFLLFAAANGAITLQDEQAAGILDRILAGPATPSALINGKYLYLLVQGFVQVGLIFVIAWLGYGVDLPGHLLPWAITTFAAAAAAAGLALLLATLCRTQRQAQTLSNIIILILSAIGGSMIPRFLMPSYLQTLGWLTPNAWALDAYTSIFWRDATMEQLVLPWLVLGTTALLAWLIAQSIATRLTNL